MPSFVPLTECLRSQEKPFMVTPEGRTVSYADAAIRSARLANVLAGLGLSRGDRLACQTEKSPEALLLYLACLRVGAVYLPLNPSYTVSEVAYVLEDAEPTIFVCDPARLPAMSEAAARAGVGHVVSLDGDGHGTLAEIAAAADPEFADAPVAPDDLAAILYTSGTTGRPKGAMLTHSNLVSNAATLVKAWGITADDVLLHALPIFHTHGLFVATNTVLLSNGTMLFLPRFDVDQVVALLPRATMLMGIPTFYTRLLRHPGFTRDLVRDMRLFISGSAPLSAETHREFEDRTGHAILERYGMTETNMNTSNPLDGARRAGTVGRPLEDVELRITDPANGRVMATGEVGVIEVRGPNVFQGYWRNPEKTREDLRPDGFFITGDLGHRDADGYVTIVGRAKDLVISGGFNVYPAEVEAALDALPGIAESAIIGVPHPDLGEGVTAVVAKKPGADLEEAAVRAALAEHLAPYKVPKRVLVVKELPRNSMGKIQKNVLREEFKDVYAGPGAIA